MEKMKQITVISVILLFYLFSANKVLADNPKINVGKISDNEYHLYKEINGVQILYKIATRIDKHNGINADYIEIMLLNTTSNKVQITWQNELWFDGKCQTCEQFNKKEYEHKVILNGSESLEGDCVSQENKDLLIFINFNDKPDVPKLSDFELKYLKVDPIIE